MAHIAARHTEFSKIKPRVRTRLCFSVFQFYNIIGLSKAKDLNKLNYVVTSEIAY